MEQKAQGNGVDSLDERDKESVIDDPFSLIVAAPTDMKSIVALNIFHSTQFTYGMNGINGFNYEHLRDNCKWYRVSKKEFIPLLMSMLNYYIKGINSKK